METRKQPNKANKRRAWENEDGSVDFSIMIQPALHFDVKAYRKRLKEEQAERRRIRELKKQYGCKECSLHRSHRGGFCNGPSTNPKNLGKCLYK